MHDIILHHYEFSTFSEKIRTALGLKQLAWPRHAATPLAHAADRRLPPCTGAATGR